jgi:alpha-1,3-mannosyltransferase
MNMLLYSPGILLCLLLATGWYETFICLSICAVWQLILGFPFLSTYPLDYLKNSFDIGRVFMFKWTVNFKFLPEVIFVSKTLSISLLMLTVAG